MGNLKLVTLLFLIHTVHAQVVTKNIVAYGALSNGITNNAAAIQKAINEMSAAGGGRVLIPRGRFMTGPICLKSNVELVLHEEAVLLGSPKQADYVSGKSVNALIYADHEKNIRITGKGMIDGQSDYLIADIYFQIQSGVLKEEIKEVNPWVKRRPEEKMRPKLIELINCEQVTIKNIHLQNGSGWIQEYRNCSKVNIDSIHVFSNAFWNNDGIDITDCKDVRITNSFVNSSDDGICLKSEDRNSRCENIYIANCKIRSSANAIKFGTASKGGFKHIVVRNIEVYDTYRSAIALEAVDGGVLEDVDVRGIRAVNTGNAIFIKLGHRNKDSVYSIVRNIYIADVKVQVPSGKPDAGYPIEGPLLKYPPGYKKDPANPFASVSPWNHSTIDSTAIVYPHNIFPSSIAGLPGHSVENVTLENIEIVYEGGGSKEVNYFPADSLHAITEAVASYPEFSMFGELPAWGMYIRHVKGLTLKNITLQLQEPDYRSAFIADDAEDLKLEKVSIPFCNTVPVIILRNARKHTLLKMELKAGEKSIKIVNSKQKLQ